MFYYRDILKIAFPIIMGNLGFIMIGVGDIIVAGRHSTDTLAAISLANAILNCIVMLGIGILASISAILSNYRGAKDRVGKYFLPSVKFAMILALITSCIILICIPIIDHIGFEQKFVQIVKDYFFISAFTTFGAYLHCMTKEYLQALEIVIFPNVLTIFCIFLNLFLNVIFVFGYKGIVPEMGATGLAIATLLVRYFMGLSLFIYCFIKLPGLKNKIIGCLNENFKKYYKDLLKVGLPVSIAIMIEFIGFNIISIVMGRINGIYAAAHNIICTLTSVSFMVPLAISNATAVKVGFCNGAEDYLNLKKYAFSGIKMSLCFMVLAGIIVGLFPKFILSIFTPDMELIKICIPIAYILCIFQVFDGLQVSLSGIFKGIKNTKIVMITNFVSYWIIAFPLGCLLAFGCKLNLVGFWTSLLIGSSIICITMLTVLHKKLNKQIIG